jgi:GNAT superfamily N-acetyltransferase
MQTTEEILTGWTQEELGAAIDGNRLAYSTLMGQSPVCELYREPDAFWIISDVPHPIPNGVAQARLAVDGIEARIDELLEPFRSRHLPMHWVVNPLSEPEDLGLHLQSRGLIFASAQPAMATNLAALDDELPGGAGQEHTKVPLRPHHKVLSIQRVSDAQMLQTWLQPFELGYQLPDLASRILEDIVFWHLGRSEIYGHYLGLLDGEPVACSSLLLAAGVAGVYNVAVVPGARRQGIGTAMTLAPLHHARAQGYRAAILFPSPMGYDLYRRLGFTTQFHQSLYIWNPETIP